MFNRNAYVCELQKLYVAYFGRPADPLVIEYWLKELKESLNLQQISYTLPSQDEYTNYYANKYYEHKITIKTSIAAFSCVKLLKKILSFQRNFMFCMRMIVSL